MTELLRRFRYPLTYALCAFLAATAVVARPGANGLGLPERAVLTVTVPLQQLATLPVREAEGFWDQYINLVGMRQENDRLREQVARLREENLQYREAIVASERYQRLAVYREAREVPMVPANVVQQDLSPWFQSIVIDQGSTAGIRPGMPVITDGGVVGVVTGTTPSHAQVLLVIDPQSRVDAFAQRTRARGSLKGAAGGRVDFEFVLREADIEAGDLLLTSGLGAVYPKGLVVGYVKSVERKPYGLFQYATVEPAVDFSKLEEVFVILERRELPESSEFTTDDASLWGSPAPAGE